MRPGERARSANSGTHYPSEVLPDRPPPFRQRVLRMIPCASSRALSALWKGPLGDGRLQWGGNSVDLFRRESFLTEHQRPVPPCQCLATQFAVQCRQTLFGRILGRNVILRWPTRNRRV